MPRESSALTGVTTGAPTGTPTGAPAQRTSSGHQVRLYSRLVAWMKIILPLGALGVIGALYFASQKTGELNDIFTTEDLATLGAGLRLDNPRFAGITDQGEPFSIHAEWALPDGAVPSFIDLERPQGEIVLKSGRSVEITATTGRMHRKEKTLILNGDVLLNTSDGFHVETERLDLDMKAKTATSPGPVTGSGPRGRIEAGSFRSIPADKTAGTSGEFWFENRVRLVLSPPNAGKSAAGSSDDDGKTD